MDSAIVIALVALVGSIGSSALTVYATLHTETSKARRDAEKTLARYREPLISATFDLQSRIYNIQRQNFLGRYVLQTGGRRREVALESTLYAFAQYFGWREVLRREVEFLDLADSVQTRDVNQLMGRITGRFATDWPAGETFLLWKPEQRAIGEHVIVEDRLGARCMGFGEFLEIRKGAIAYWLDPLEEALIDLAKDHTNERLRDVQHLLTELVRKLDPDAIRYGDSVLKPV